MFFPEESERYRNKHTYLIKQLLANGTRATPERIQALSKFSKESYNRKLLDDVFSISESVSLPANPETANFDPGFPRLTNPEICSILNRNPENKRWLQETFRRVAHHHDISIDKDIISTGNQLLTYLTTKVSYWEADSFPLDAMTDLRNRYDWTFQTDAWSLREQLRREANVIFRGWIDLFELTRSSRLFVILNQCTPTDYFCSFLPKGVSLFRKDTVQTDKKILLYTDLKISSSEHRILLEHTVEGKDLETAMKIAAQLERIPVLCDFSRRRFSRAIMRATRFAVQKKWGIKPLGKMFDPQSTCIPEAKSANGFAQTPGEPQLMLFDPWPISDNKIIPKLPPQIKPFLNQQPQTKPWQDDRIGARRELEMNDTGMYQENSESWVVPALGGWMRVNHVFQSRLARFLSIKDYENYA